MQHTQAIVHRFMRLALFTNAVDLEVMPKKISIAQLSMFSYFLTNSNMQKMWVNKIYPYINHHWNKKAFKHFDEENIYSTELKTYILRMYGCYNLKELEKVKCQKWHFVYPFQYWFHNFKFKEEIMLEWNAQISQKIQLK